MPILIIALLAVAFAVALGLVVARIREGRRSRTFQVPNKLPSSVAREITRRQIPRKGGPQIPRHT